MMNALVVTDNSPRHWNRCQLFIYLFFHREILRAIWNASCCEFFSHLRVEKKCNFGLTCIRFKLSYRYLAKDKWNFHAWYFLSFLSTYSAITDANAFFGIILFVDAYQLYLHLFVIIDCMRLNVRNRMRIAVVVVAAVDSYRIYNRFIFKMPKSANQKSKLKQNVDRNPDELLWT